VSAPKRYYEVEIRVAIQERYTEGGYSNQRFDTAETFRLMELSSFADIASVLGQFHQLAETMKNEAPA
jgi:hypothetical protein